MQFCICSRLVTLSHLARVLKGVSGLIRYFMACDFTYQLAGLVALLASVGKKVAITWCKLWFPAGQRVHDQLQHMAVLCWLGDKGVLLALLVNAA